MVRMFKIVLTNRRDIRDARPMKTKGVQMSASQCDTACENDCAQSCGCESSCEASCGCNCSNEYAKGATKTV